MLVRAAIWSIVFPLCFALGSCSRKPPALPAVKIGLVVDVRGFSDRSFNARALAALTQCRRRTGVGIDAQAPQTAADYGPKLVLLATQNYDAVIAMGPSMAHDVSEAARRFANTHFALIGAVVDEPNVNSITFKEQDGSFLAGALAAMVSKTKSVAFLGGADVPQLEPSLAGFEAGVRQVDARVRVRVRYLGSFDDTSAAHGAAGALYREGSDIIYTVAGRSGLGAIAAAKEGTSRYVIGVDSDQDALAPGKVLTSVVKDVGAAVSRVCREIHAQKPITGLLVLGLSDDGIRLTDFRYSRGIVGTANIDRLRRLQAAIVTGRIGVPANRKTLRTFRAVTLDAAGRTR